MRGMSRLSCVLAATVALFGCPASNTPTKIPEAVDDTAVRIRVAQAEARRADGVVDLVELAAHGEESERLLALRGLGRVGGTRALEVLRKALQDPNRSIVIAAASAIGVMTQLDEPEPSADLTRELLSALERATDPAVIEAIGRAGDASAHPTLVKLLTSAPPIGDAAAFAFARHGRRKIEIAGEVRLALVALSQADPVRSYAAVHALAREHIAPATIPSASGAAASNRAAKAISLLIPDAAPETRAQAIAALNRQGLVRLAHKEIEQALLDSDWRVAVEAVRALTGDKGDDAGRDAVAAALVRRFAELERGMQSEAHVVIEGLRALGSHAKRPLVATSVGAIASKAASTSKVSGLTHAWIECLAGAVLVRGSETPDLSWIDGCSLPDHLKLPLIAELITANVGTVAARRTALASLLSHKDVRVRAAGLGALAALWKEGGEGDHRAAVSTLVGAIGSKDPILAGSAIDAAPAIYEAIGTGDHQALDAAILDRARKETDAELSAALLELVGKQKLAGGAEVCRAGLALASHPVRAKAARSCLRALGEAPPAGDVAPATAPAIDVTRVIGKRVTWTLTTARGDIAIHLRPEVAPWAVSTIATLTAKGYYDGLEIHRVVPNFVVQGGDPTMSGWGGPGFTLPSEPASLTDGGGFTAGGVGIADAGRDSGGSQWFVMHSRGPHLDGRYTWIGEVVSGQKSADALVIGDKVVRATVTIAE